ncbi:LysR family transcriptional regulator [Acetobacteraceae bacterium H6797]|nr:LysR family transcriptional regulator [Acetobacteraceae bacterium H6797]
MTLLRRGLLPPLGELTAFEAAARHASFTRAAEELSLTQGAISRLIKALEARLAIMLFERVRQRVVLTEAGRAYLADIEPLLGALGDATQRAMSAGGGEAVLNLATLPTFGAQWLIPRLPGFLAAHPGVVVNLSTRVLPVDFAREGFDAAIHVGQPSWPGVRALHLMDEEVIPVASPGYREAMGLRGPADLARAVLLHQATRPMAWVDWFAAQGVEAAGYRGPRFEQFGLVAEAAAVGMGVGLLPRFLIEEKLAAGRLVVLSERGVKTGGAYWFVTPEGKTASRALRDFSAWIGSEAPSLA